MGEEPHRARYSDTGEEGGSFWHSVWQRLCSGKSFETVEPALASEHYCWKQPVNRDCYLHTYSLGLY